MSAPGEDIERLAQELPGRSSSDLDQEEQDVLARVVAGSFIGIDAADAGELRRGKRS